MNLIKIFFPISLILLLAGCVRQVPSDSSMKNEVSDTKDKTTYFKNTQEIKQKPEYKLSKNENEFLNILENDTYASLCASQDRYLQIKDMQNSKDKSEALKDLFYSYTKNLANSCIDQDSFKNSLKSTKYKKRKQYYEIYNIDIKRDEITKKFDSSLSVKEILAKYTPKHPDFFKLIEKLDINKLSSKEYNRLRLNIERLKLLKDYKSENFVQLNVPSYNFTLYENGEVERKFGTIVGEKDSQTPILSSKLSYFIINPAWNIPDSISKETIIPRALKDKNYLKRKNIVIRKKSYKLDAPKVRFKDVNWKKYLKKHVKYIPYKFIQLPSRTNGMGRVKFMFPNDYAVYMHDTIGTWRFKRDSEKIRFVSHGCVRLEHPISFMKHITKKYTPKTYKSIRKTYLSSEMRTVGLSKKLPVHITYVTSYLKNGKLKFYKDIYEYDKIQKLNFIAYDNALVLAQAKKSFNKFN